MMMPNPSWKANIDQLSSDWIDGRDGEVQPVDASRLPSSEETTGQHYLADLLLVDALLTNMADGAGSEQQKRIRRVMDAIDRPVGGQRYSDYPAG